MQPERQGTPEQQLGSLSIHSSSWPQLYSRIKAVRQDLFEALTKLNPDKDWSFVVKQIGALGAVLLRRCSGGAQGRQLHDADMQTARDAKAGAAQLGAACPRTGCTAPPCPAAAYNQPAPAAPAAGMFTFTGMTPAQCDNMTNKWHVYMTRDGRLSLAGLSKAKCAYLAQAIDDSVRNH